MSPLRRLLLRPEDAGPRDPGAVAGPDHHLSGVPGVLGDGEPSSSVGDAGGWTRRGRGRRTRSGGDGPRSGTGGDGSRTDGDGDRRGTSPDADGWSADDPGAGRGGPPGRGTVPGLAVVLAPPDRALLAGAAVAAASGGRGSGAPVLAVWDPRSTPTPGDGPTSTGRARRAAGIAEACGVAAQAVGRTVRVDLPADDVQAVAAAERLEATGGLGPVVLVVAGPWGAPFLAPIERAGVVHADGGPAALAACGRTLARHGVEVVRVPEATGPVARALLRAGWVGRSQVVAPARDDRGPSLPARPGDDRGPSLPGRVRDDRGQSLLFVLGALLLAITLAGVLGAVASAMGGREERQRAVDLAALAAADRMRADWPARAGSPATIGTDRYRERASAAARRAAAANGVDAVTVSFPDPEADEAGPLTVRVRAAGRSAVAGVDLGATVEATAELSPPALPVDVATGDEYDGPLATRQGKPMRPDVAMAFDRMNAAATKAGRPLTVTSGYRSNAEQARLFAAHPDPKWVARPGTSLHRMGTELDLGPPAAYGWLAANSMRFGFKKRYSWEPWHFGFVRETGSAHVAEQGRNPKAPASSGALPPWTPARYRPTILAASIRFKVSAALLAAQLKQESGFDPTARSGAGAQGIAQFMPGTARAVGLRDPFDPEQAIPAQARLMSTLLRRFGSVQLALAAYNAGEGNVAPCGCIPPFPETRHYVATIIALMKGYDPTGGLADVFTIRLTR